MCLGQESDAFGRMTHIFFDNGSECHLNVMQFVINIKSYLSEKVQADKPNLRQKTPNMADSSTTRRSHIHASSRPPATAYPETAAITGLLNMRLEGPYNM